MTDDVQIPPDAVTLTPSWFNILASHDAEGNPTVALALQDPKLGPFLVEVPVDIGVLIGTALINGAANHYSDNK